MQYRVAIIVGSHRQQSQSAKVGKYLHHHIGTAYPYAETVVIDLGEKPLPLWDEDHWRGQEIWQTQWKPISDVLHTCDAFVIVVPEWNGMATPAIKNFFLLCHDQELAHKPALIVSVSSGQGGSYPIAELRMSSYKNTRICYIPDHVIVKHVAEVLNGDAIPLTEDDQYIRDRLHQSLRVLHAYAKALLEVRNANVCDIQHYPFGM